jgi:hypothetical protein
MQNFRRNERAHRFVAYRRVGPRLGIALALVVIALVDGASANGPVQRYDADRWIEDLRAIRSALAEKYANFEWAVFEREIDLSDLFARTEARLREVASDVEAKAAIDRLTRILGDGHVRVRWKRIRPHQHSSRLDPLIDTSAAGAQRACNCHNQLNTVVPVFGGRGSRAPHDHGGRPHEGTRNKGQKHPGEFARKLSDNSTSSFKTASGPRPYLPGRRP